MKKKYKYEGKSGIIVYEDGEAIEVLPGKIVELKKKPNMYFVMVSENDDKEIKKDKKNKKKGD